MQRNPGRNLGLRAVVFAMVSTLATAGVALGQTTGISHPDDIPVTTSPEGIVQPVVYESPASAVVVMKAEPAASSIAPAQVRQPHQPLPEPPVMQAAVAQPALAEAHADREPATVSEAFVETREIPQQMRAHSPLDDPDAGIVTRVPGPANQLPIGAMLHIRLRQALTTTGTHPGTVFTASLLDAVQRDGRVLLPAGATVEGKVTQVTAGKRTASAASIHLTPLSVVLPDGTRYPLRAQVIDSSMYRTTKVDEEGTITHKNRKGTIAAVGLATGAGAAAGAVFGGWPGAIVGGVIGAGVSTVVWLRQDRQADLPAGTEVVLSLTGPLTVGNQ